MRVRGSYVYCLYSILDKKKKDYAGKLFFAKLSMEKTA